MRKERLLMEIREWGEEHWIWKEGWPQPGEEEKGKGGVEELKGGQGDIRDDGIVKQGSTNAGVGVGVGVDVTSVIRKKKVKGTTIFGGRGGGDGGGGIWMKTSWACECNSSHQWKRERGGGGRRRSDDLIGKWGR
ncbi:hypothetical protein Ancab_020627 [Ancistrocladus abbreviatus]